VHWRLSKHPRLCGLVGAAGICSRRGGALVDTASPPLGASERPLPVLVEPVAVRLSESEFAPRQQLLGRWLVCEGAVVHESAESLRERAPLLGRPGEERVVDPVSETSAQNGNGTFAGFGEHEQDGAAVTSVGDFRYQSGVDESVGPSAHSRAIKADRWG
jgi:hypothetical protein